MILARKLKLIVSDEQHKVLIETLDQYKKCVDRVFEYGFQNHLISGSTLHKATYYELRNEYPNLPSALVCCARVKATEALKAIKKQTKNKVFNIGNFNTNIIQLTNKILKLTKIKNINIHHEKNTIDKRSYEVSVKSSKKFQKQTNLNKLTNESILETFSKIKKDKNPFAKNKVYIERYLFFSIYGRFAYISIVFFLAFL